MQGHSRLLKPSNTEIRELAQRETDPQHVHEFEQLCPGSFVSVLLLFAIGIATVVITPFRIAARVLRRIS